LPGERRFGRSRPNSKIVSIAMSAVTVVLSRAKPNGMIFKQDAVQQGFHA